MSRIKLNYTSKSRIWLFKQMVERVGPWNKDWKATPSPSNLNTKDTRKLYADLHQAYEKKFPNLVKRKITEDELTEGKTGIMQMFAWTLTTQREHISMTRELRILAYSAGFLTMGDIIYLEEMQKQRYSQHEKSNVVMFDEMSKRTFVSK